MRFRRIVSVFQHFRLINRLYCITLKLTTCQRKGNGFVPKDSIELMRARKEEIICAFEQLFQKKKAYGVFQCEKLELKPVLHAVPFTIIFKQRKKFNLD